jgi:hypothetical protein
VRRVVIDADAEGDARVATPLHTAFEVAQALRGTRVEVDLARAVHLGLRTTFNLRQHGHAFNVGSTSRTSNFFLTRDGRHIYLLRNNGRGTITENLIGLLRCPNSTEGIAAAVGQWDSHELEEALAAIKLPGVVARTPEEWLAHPQGRLLAAQPGLTIRKLGDSAPEPFAPAERPLSGIRVLDASHVIAGPSTGRLLAEQGAEVLQVSNPAERETQQIIMDLGFGKRAAYIDLQRVQDVAQLRKLAAQADVFKHHGQLRRRDRRVVRVRRGADHHADCVGDVVVAEVAHGDGRRARGEDTVVLEVLHENLHARGQRVVEDGAVGVHDRERGARGQAVLAHDHVAGLRQDVRAHRLGHGGLVDAERRGARRARRPRLGGCGGAYG